MNRARRLTPTVHVHKPPHAPWAWTYSLDGKESDVYHLTRQGALLEAQQQANRIGLQRRQTAAMDRQAAAVIEQEQRKYQHGQAQAAVAMMETARSAPLVERPASRMWAGR